MMRSPALPARAATALVLAGLLVTQAAWAPTPAAGQRDPREMQAREAYAASRYQEALDLYVKLYAEHLHPNYLRNIGRCYQNLGQPDKAISSFREYLRKAKNLAPGERQEIEGYIKEMEELKQRQTTAAAPTPPAPQANDVLPPTPTVAATAAPPLDLGPPPPASVEAEASPVYKRWWFWTAIGAAVVGGTVAVILATRNKGDDLCNDMRVCQ